jgi:hypothetical protein
MAEITKSNPLLITIGSHPTNSLNVDQELKLLKAAILYGDKVELYSLKASVFRLIRMLKDIPVPLQFKIIEEVSPFLMGEIESAAFLENLVTYKEIITKKTSSLPILILQRRFSNEWLKAVNTIEQMVQTSGFEDIERGIKTGIVKLHTFENAKNQLQAVDYLVDSVALASNSPLLEERRKLMEDRNGPLLEEYVQGMISAINDGSSLPLFDEQTSSLIYAGIREGLIIPTRSAAGQAKHSALAADLLEKIPHFEDASIDQILEIRNELDRHLIRFRSALISYSEKIKSEAWEKDFPVDAENVFRRDVAPAILDIEDATKSNKIIAKIIHDISEKPIAVASGSAIGLAISTFSGLPEAISISLGAGIAVSTIIFDAFTAWTEKNRLIQQNTMYFFYSVAKKLKK